jgi:hypothetical protein
MMTVLDQWQNANHHRVAAEKSLKLSAADRPLRCMVMFWLFFVLVLVLSEAVLVLDRSSNCIIPSWSTR